MAIRPENSLPLTDSLSSRNSGLTELNRDSSQQKTNQDRARTGQNSLDNRATNNSEDVRISSNPIQQSQRVDQAARQDGGTNANQNQRLDNRQTTGNIETSQNDQTSSLSPSNLASSDAVQLDNQNISQNNLQNRLSRVNIDDSGIGLTSNNQLLESFSNLREILSQNSQGAIERAYNGSGSLISILV